MAIVALPQGTTGQYLSSNGTWQSLPASATTWSISGNDILSTNSGNVNINSNFIFGNSGTFKNNAWAGTGSRLLKTDATGNVTPFANGTNGQYLDGTGAWLNLPNALSSFSTTGNKIYLAPTMSLGIGTSNPAYVIDVAGDARIQNNLYVGGGIIITDAITADTVHMGPGRVIDGSTLINGDLTTSATRSIIAGGDVIANSKLTVQGNATFNGALNLNQGLMFNTNNGFKLQSVTTGSTTSDVFVVGRQTGAFQSFLGTCPAPGIGSWFLNNGGGFVSAINGQTTPYQNVNASLKMYTGNWNGDGFIEVEGTDANGTQNNVLALNYFCGRPIWLNTGPTSGKVFVGKFLSAAQHVEIGDPIYGIAPNNAPPTNVALDLHVNFGRAIKVKTYDQSLSMYEVERVTSATTSETVFKVFGNGNTQIGNPLLTSSPHYNTTALSVNGKIVAKEIIVTQQAWADYVFANTYKLRSLESLENYITKNKHLPNIPSASEVENNGINVAEISKLQMEKIEELTLYIIEQNKKIEKQQQELIELKKDVNKLKQNK